MPSSNVDICIVRPPEESVDELEGEYVSAGASGLGVDVPCSLNWDSGGWNLKAADKGSID